MVRRSTEREIIEHNAIEAQRQRTHDAVLDEIGSSSATSMDILKGAIKVGGFTAGRLVHVIGSGVHAAVQGLMGKPYPRKQK